MQKIILIPSLINFNGLWIILYNTIILKKKLRYEHPTYVLKGMSLSLGIVEEYVSHLV